MDRLDESQMNVPPRAMSVTSAMELELNGSAASPARLGTTNWVCLEGISVISASSVSVHSDDGVSRLKGKTRVRSTPRHGSPGDSERGRPTNRNERLPINDKQKHSSCYTLRKSGECIWCCHGNGLLDNS